MNNLEILINDLVNVPTEENKSLYFREIYKIEYQLLEEAETFTKKSKEYFSKRTEAFSIRRKSAMKLISEWVKKYQSSEGCPVSYADTLNIPFQTIKGPNA